MPPPIPKLLFIGAGNIAKSIMKGILRARPDDAKRILAIAPTHKNLAFVRETLGCRTTLLREASVDVTEFQPDFVFLCVKPQVLKASITEQNKDDLYQLLKSMPSKCPTLSLLAGVKSVTFEALTMPRQNVVRVMLNTASEVGATSVLYHAHAELQEQTVKNMEELFRLISQSVIRLNDENLMDVATGVCGSGIAFFYEMIQTISDIGVKNGLSRSDATSIAAQLSKAAGEMVLTKNKHPYELRDEVTSPAGTTIYGLSTWHQNSTGHRIGEAFQASIDRAKELAAKPAG